MNQIDYAIFEINNSVKCKLAASPIHGVGVFAIYDIQKGDKLFLRPSESFFDKPPRAYNLSYASLSKLLPEVRQLLLERWPSIINGSIFVSPNDMAVLCTFVNHSDDPNYDIDTDSALRDIKGGEEITENYRLMDNYLEIYKWLK